MIGGRSYGARARAQRFGPSTYRKAVESAPQKSSAPQRYLPASRMPQARTSPPAWSRI